ncbi:MAG: hypothetical protein ACTH31_09440 [Pseudoclavibacter sp.]
MTTRDTSARMTRREHRMPPLALAVSGKKRVPAGSTPFGYAKGSAAFPTVMVALSLAEVVVVHILVPWEWAKILLLILTVWGVLVTLGAVAARLVHPHYIEHGMLHLRWGRERVLATPVTNIVAATLHANHAHTQPAVLGDSVMLTQFQSTNVMIRFAEPVAVDPPVSKQRRNGDVNATEVQLFVDDPAGFLRALGIAATKGGS